MRISASRIKAFKSCRRMYELKYIENLIPIEKPQALEIGSNYHKLLECINSGISIAGFSDDYSKEMAMAIAYERHILPKVHCKNVEVWFEKRIGNDVVVGRVDGITDDGHIIEHKTCSSKITDKYEYDLMWDEQILMYMFLTGVRKIWYTVCMKPTIKQRQFESDEEFFYRMIEWYEDDTDSKIRLFEIERTDEEVVEFEQELLRIIDDMNAAPHYYRNPCHCNMYGRRCEYSSICLHYDKEQQYIEFMKGEEYEHTEN